VTQYVQLLTASMHKMEMNEMEARSDQIDQDNDAQEDGSFLSSYEQQQKTIAIVPRQEMTSSVSPKTESEAINLTSRAKQCCSRKRILRTFPILTWIKSYNLTCFIFDLIAGITVGLTVIPQSIAYAAVAGLPLQYGLYTAFMGPFLYIIFGTAKEVSIGPTAIMSLMTQTYVMKGGPAYAVLLAFLSGCVELAAGLLNLGFVVDFISTPVISGFCSAAALTVASTQMKGLLGIKFKGSHFIDVWAGVFSHFSEINVGDAGLGFAAIVILLLMRKMTALKDIQCLKNRLKCLQNRFVIAAIWFTSTSRNAFAVIFCSIAAFILEKNDWRPFTLTGDIQAGLPPFAFPAFTANRTIGNTTVELGFGDIVSELGSSIGLVPLIAILEQVAIAKSFASGKKTDATQEMFALGVATIMGSFFGAYPISASFGRSSVQFQSGVKTTLSNIYGGILVLFALAFLMPSLAYIPKSVLAAVIITSVIFMVEYEEIMPMWRSRRVELLPFTLTFVCCLFVSMESGILIGTAFHLLLLAYLGNKPSTELTHLSGNQLTEDRFVIKVDRNLYFPGVETFRKSINKAGEKASSKDSSSLVIDLENVSEMDYTALKTLESLVKEFHKKDLHVHFANANERVKKSIESSISNQILSFQS